MSSQLVTVDTSVVVPALVSWHERHDEARRAIRPASRLPGHVLFETVSVLTRLPHGLAVDAALAAELLTEAFPDAPLVLDEAGHQRLLRTVAEHRIHGGAVYDALIGATAAAGGATLRSFDVRARETYRAVGAKVEWP